MSKPQLLKAFTVWGDPAGAIRMSQSDRWIGSATRRPRTEKEAARQAQLHRTRDFRERVLEASGYGKKKTLYVPAMITMRIYFAIPPNKKTNPGMVHTQTPDTDNVLKAVKDALFKNDQMIWCDHAEKYWDDGKGPRVDVELLC